MPESGKNLTVRATATKAVNHGKPVQEGGAAPQGNIIGVAVKTQAASAGAGAGTAQRQIAITERFTVIQHGMVVVDNTDAGIAALAPGAAVYITDANNNLAAAGGAGFHKYGIVVHQGGAGGTTTEMKGGLPLTKVRIDLDGKDKFV